MGLLPSLLFCQPKLKLPGGTTFDFGEVYTGAVVKKNIILKNVGKDTLNVDNVSTSCGCTATLLSKNAIAPKDSGNLQITFDSKKFTGKVEKAVTFETNDTTQKKVRIIFNAEVTPLLEFEPDHIVYNVVYTDTDNVKVLNITNASANPIRIVSVQAVPDGQQQAEAQPAKVKKKLNNKLKELFETPSDIKFELSDSLLYPRTKATINCTLNTKREGLHKGNIVIKTDNVKMNEFNFRYIASVRKK